MSKATIAEAKAFLEQQREDWRRGWGEKGKLTDPNALHAIDCLTVAIDNLKSEPIGRKPHIGAKSHL